MRDPEVIKLLNEQQVTPMAMGPEEFEALIKKDLERWANVIKTAGIKENERCRDENRHDPADECPDGFPGLATGGSAAARLRGGARQLQPAGRHDVGQHLGRGD